MPAPASLIRLSLALVVIATTGAAAEQRGPTSRENLPRPSFVRRPGAAVAPRTAPNANVSSRVVYLKRCPLFSGCTLKEGPDDSRTDTSSIVDGGSRVLGEFKQGDQVWDDLVACVKTTFAPFDITITDQDPGDVPHWMNVVGGKAADISSQFGPNTGGLAPFDCGEIPNAIVYTFDIYGPDAEALCWTSSQEIAHAFGLEHEFLQKDPLTYLDGDMPKRFRDVDAPCGEYEQNAGCMCGGTTQNTYRTIVEMFGPGAPTPPDVLFKRPVEGKEVQPGFTAVIDAQDDVRVEKVELFADGVSIGMTMLPVGGAFELEAPELGRGAHVLEARATDVQGVVGMQTINVTEGPPCTPDKGCTGKDVCADGVCVPGPEEAGGLGDVCQSDTECLSHHCGDAGEKLKYCVESCTPSSSNSCPNDFQCIAAGADGVCWPASGGCCDAGARPHGSIVLALGVLVVLGRRRRRPAR